MFMFGTKLITQVLKWLEAEGKNSCFVVFPFALTAMPNFPIIIYKTTVHEFCIPVTKSHEDKNDSNRACHIPQIIN